MIQRYGIAVVSVICATAILNWMTAVLQNAAHVSLLLSAVVFSAWFGGRGPGLLATALSGLTFSYYFLAPAGMAVDASAWPRLLMFGLVALFITWLTAVQGRTTESLKDSKRHLESLSLRLLTAQEEERRRLAVELHDELGQVLTAVKINLASLERQSGTAPPPAHLRDALASVRRSRSPRSGGGDPRAGRARTCGAACRSSRRAG